MTFLPICTKLAPEQFQAEGFRWHSINQTNKQTFTAKQESAKKASNQPPVPPWRLVWSFYF
jgi:hypothetical protein